MQMSTTMPFLNVSSLPDHYLLPNRDAESPLGYTYTLFLMCTYRYTCMLNTIYIIWGFMVVVQGICQFYSSKKKQP